MATSRLTLPMSGSGARSTRGMAACVTEMSQSRRHGHEETSTQRTIARGVGRSREPGTESRLAGRHEMGDLQRECSPVTTITNAQRYFSVDTKESSCGYPELSVGSIRALFMVDRGRDIPSLTLLRGTKNASKRRETHECHHIQCKASNTCQRGQGSSTKSSKEDSLADDLP